MNNEQFRRLLVDNSSDQSGGKPAASMRNVAPGNATPGRLLGSRMRSSIPMTPRSVTGVDFARQLAEQRREGDQRPTKRFKSSAAPKGTKLPTGYQDRAQLRHSQDEEQEESSFSKRITALEEMVKLGQMDQASFEKLRAELGVGGDTGSTHMVKGLDWELLKRVKAGDDVSQAAQKAAPEPATTPTGEDAEEEFERLTEAKSLEDIQAAPKVRKEKKGTMAPPPPPPRRTRDEILKELRASRAAAASAPAAQPESVLGSRFKKLRDGKPEKKRFVETDETGRRREVLVITDAEGNTKRKVRWLDKPVEPGPATLPMPAKDAKPLGMEVPAEIAARNAAHVASDEDDDIFTGVGADYDPLAGIEEDEDSSDEDGELTTAAAVPDPMLAKDDDRPPTEPAPVQRRNYFTTTASPAAPEEPEDRSNPLGKDPTILAALKRAAALRATSPSGEDEVESPDASQRHKRFLEEARRRDALDATDMDLGFGESRIEDGEEEEGVLLDFDGQERGGKKRKRGPKKKKGDKDSAADVMRVLEGRQKDAE
ncbi:hypothetical protein N7492_004261 [Penicillium capsulatum]|uniref:RED-like N-terminal domain-containing protein n=1 Tax=Penicillium capsulatum TaxID=69766 RepID=A0A9W9LQZ8_9EURO|nr:hypothetical protein N7492_004261 [Penicillium capsulatum]KAJ6136619.1 hypothetical protein N7512_001779 [Penicillium capsulatum]